MGRQINYYMDYTDFLKIAQTALNCGCQIIKETSTKLVISSEISAVTKDCKQYYFYLPEADELCTRTYGEREVLDLFHMPCVNAVIQAGYSHCNDRVKEITRSRLYVASGYFTEAGEWIPRPDSLNKVYSRLMRAVKKLAPYTEVTDIISNPRCEQREWTRREYISLDCLHLKENCGYRLSG